MTSGDTQARRVSDVVHERMRQEILGGRLEPGAAVPSERMLAERFGVNRHAVREALKRLEQAGLVQISQGGPTRVLDWRESGGLEVLLDLIDDPGELPPQELVRAVLELRACIGTDAARRCAERADRATRAEVARLARETARLAGDAPASAAPAAGQHGGVEPGDDATPAAAVTAYDELWREIVRGAGNLAYRLALNSLLAALASFPLLAAALVPTDGARLAALGDAVAAGDPAAAEAAARALLEADEPPR
ncbi:GntR family transcriptional regulator [Conexibacter stalactiti]|uniref:GntR family transcriptional regulator n=1 Tax=Conexibacter stalactiti TaxID=1940611 RepID=A0ABU4HR65_9ACTN|nr:GntR family transcriptional regulator [Conexibacter stalactiti]MDW5595788.1 GntR family transcriptional regulator [Conexibacter stalactiti]MEC5036430.1 GntR family transcriptional regulator [Conexibacter stalactiti]